MKLTTQKKSDNNDDSAHLTEREPVFLKDKGDSLFKKGYFKVMKHAHLSRVDNHPLPPSDLPNAKSETTRTESGNHKRHTRLHMQLAFNTSTLRHACTC